MSDNLSSVKRLVERLRLPNTDASIDNMAEIHGHTASIPRGAASFIKLATAWQRCVTPKDAHAQKRKAQVKPDCLRQSTDNDRDRPSVVRSRNDRSKRKVSVTKSMPLSPTSPRSMEKESELFHDSQLALDTLTAELVCGFILFV